MSKKSYCAILALGLASSLALGLALPAKLPLSLFAASPALAQDSLIQIRNPDGSSQDLLCRPASPQEIQSKSPQIVQPLGAAAQPAGQSVNRASGASSRQSQNTAPPAPVAPAVSSPAVVAPALPASPQPSGPASLVGTGLSPASAPLQASGPAQPLGASIGTSSPGPMHTVPSQSSRLYADPADIALAFDYYADRQAAFASRGFSGPDPAGAAALPALKTVAPATQSRAATLPRAGSSANTQAARQNSDQGANQTNQANQGVQGAAAGQIRQNNQRAGDLPLSSNTAAASAAAPAFNPAPSIAPLPEHGQASPAASQAGQNSMPANSSAPASQTGANSGASSGSAPNITALPPQLPQIASGQSRSTNW